MHRQQRDSCLRQHAVFAHRRIEDEHRVRLSRIDEGAGRASKAQRYSPTASPEKSRRGPPAAPDA